MMDSKTFVNTLIDAAKNHKTLYVMGCFGAPMTESAKARYTKNHPYNARNDRRACIEAADAKTFGFDCVCLIKGILWGWDADLNDVYGGADYAVNGVPDIDADRMIDVCENVSGTDWDEMLPGEAVWLPGHIGVYIGNGLAVECSPRWDNGVQITAVGNIGAKSGYNTRAWQKHGRLPYVQYIAAPVPTPTPTGKTYTVKSGDSLWAIAESQLHDGTRWKEIQRLNGMTDTMIHPGDVLKLPGGSEPEGKTYTVKSGDSLWAIAESQLHDGTRWKEIQRLNGMTDTMIHPGDVLKLPN